MQKPKSVDDIMDLYLSQRRRGQLLVLSGLLWPSLAFFGLVCFSVLSGLCFMALSVLSTSQVGYFWRVDDILVNLHSAALNMWILASLIRQGMWEIAFSCVKSFQSYQKRLCCMRVQRLDILGQQEEIWRALSVRLQLVTFHTHRKTVVKKETITQIKL